MIVPKTANIYRKKNRTTCEYDFFTSLKLLRLIYKYLPCFNVEEFKQATIRS
jgi:hypothetical protein